MPITGAVPAGPRLTWASCPARRTGAGIGLVASGGERWPVAAGRGVSARRCCGAGCGGYLVLRSVNGLANIGDSCR